MTASLVIAALVLGAGQDATDAPPGLASWIPPVSGRLFSVAGKLEVTPGLGFSLADPFLEKIIPQLSIGYHLDEAFYLGAKLGYGLSFSAGEANACASVGSGLSCGGPTSAQLAELPGQMSGFGLVEFGWTPIYGKLRLVGDEVLHFDFSLLLGAGAILAGLPAAPDGTTAAKTTVAPALGPGVGERFFVSDGMAVALELRDYLYEAGGVQGQLVFNVGFSFLFGGGGH